MKKLEIFIVSIIKLTVYYIAIVGVIAFIGDSLFPSTDSEFILRISTFIGLTYLFSAYKVFRNTFTKDENLNTNNSTTVNTSRNEYPLKPSFQNTPQTNESSNFTQLSPIENIERQYEKGIFTEKEKNELIDNIINENQKYKTEIINDNYKNVLDPYRDLFLEMYSVEYVELEILFEQGIINDKTFDIKLKLLKINIAKRIQKEIKFKTIKGFEIFVGLEVKNENLHGVIVEIVNSKEVHVQLTWDRKISKPWPIAKLSSNGKVNFDIKDWDLAENNFLLQDDNNYFDFQSLKIGDKYKDGEVFNVSNNHISIYKMNDNTISTERNKAYIHNSYENLKSFEDDFWKIPDTETVKKFVKYFINHGAFVPISPNLIWTSDILDSSATKCVQVYDNYKEPISIVSSNAKHHYGILIHTIKL